MAQPDAGSFRVSCNILHRFSISCMSLIGPYLHVDLCHTLCIAIGLWSRSRRSVCGLCSCESSGLSSARRGVDGRSDFRGVRFDASPKYRRMHSFPLKAALSSLPVSSVLALHLERKKAMSAELARSESRTA